MAQQATQRTTRHLFPPPRQHCPAKAEQTATRRKIPISCTCVPGLPQHRSAPACAQLPLQRIRRRFCSSSALWRKRRPHRSFFRQVAPRIRSRRRPTRPSHSLPAYLRLF
eukprot:570913-Pleurochrysis_carterae.AAC.1